MDPAVQLSYIDHPGMVGWWIWCGVHLLGDTALGVRLLAVGSSLVVSLIVWDAARTAWGSREAGARAAIWLNATILFNAAGVLMTPDAPLILFWTLALWSLVRLAHDGNPRWLYAAGLACGLGAVSKYTMGLILPGAVVTFLAFRRCAAGSRASISGWRRPWRFCAPRRSWAGTSTMAALGWPSSSIMPSPPASTILWPAFCIHRRRDRPGDAAAVRLRAVAAIPKPPRSLRAFQSFGRKLSQRAGRPCARSGTESQVAVFGACQCITVRHRLGNCLIICPQIHAPPTLTWATARFAQQLRQYFRR